MSIPLHLRPVVVGIGIAAVTTLVGMHLGDAVLVALVVAVLGTVWMTIETGEADTWREAAPEDAAGARRELAVLTWAFLGRDGRVSEAAVRRLRVLATRRLARGGLVVVGGVGPRPSGLDHPTREAAAEILGERAWTVLTAPGGWMPSLADVAHCVEVIEGLSPTAIAAHRDDARTTDPDPPDESRPTTPPARTERPTP